MNLWTQDILCGTLVLACGAWALWHASKTLRGKKSKLGSCCSKGCDAGTPKTAASLGEKIHFLPADMLRKR